MNQPNAPVMAPRATASAEGPDFVSVLRRYTWLLIAGAVAGAAVSGGLFAYYYRYDPHYTARLPFVVKPVPAPIGTDSSTILMGSDDTSQLINRQLVLFDQDTFLTEIMKDDDFRKDHNHPDDPRYTSGWLMEYGKDPKELRKDLNVVPRLNAATFEITMTTRDPVESFNLVQAAAKVFQRYLLETNNKDKDTRRRTLQAALEVETQKYNAQQRAVKDYASSKNIDVLRTRIDIEKLALQELNSLYSQASAQAETAEAQWTAIAALRKDWLDGKVAEMKLAPEMEQYLERDPTLEQLKSEKLGQEQEKAVAEKNRTITATGQLTAIQARIDKIDEQITSTNAENTKTAARRMEDQAHNEFTGKKVLADKYKVKQENEALLMSSLSADMMDYQQKLDDLKVEQELLNKMRLQTNLADANRSADDVRIQQMIDMPAVPNEISWPKWYVFLPIGTVAGLGLSTLLAYLLMLTDTRVRTPRDITRTLQLPMLGFVPDEGDDRTLNGDVETAILSSPASMIAESFRQIRSHVTAQTAHNPINTLLVASIAPGGGATTVASNLAAAMALNDLRVLLVDVNFYRPSLNRIFKNIPADGVAEAVNEPAILESAIVPHPNLPKLHLLGAGGEVAGTSEVIESKQFRDLLEHLKSKYDLIVLDGAPLNLVSASISLASRVDGVICVVRAGEVSRGTVSRVRDQLRGVHANLLGFILNAAQTNNTGYFKENYRTFYRYAGKNVRQPVGTN